MPPGCHQPVCVSLARYRYKRLIIEHAFPIVSSRCQGLRPAPTFFRLQALKQACALGLHRKRCQEVPHQAIQVQATLRSPHLPSAIIYRTLTLSALGQKRLDTHCIA